MKKVSTLVVNYNGEDVISGCLASLLEQDYEDLEILEVDNRSKDGSQVLVKYNFFFVRDIHRVDKKLGTNQEIIGTDE